MKLSIYFDVEPWMTEPECIFPTMTPQTKSAAATRYRVDVEIPDPAKPDTIISGEAVEVTG